jgi:hypothetical protein
MEANMFGTPGQAAPGETPVYVPETQQVAPEQTTPAPQAPTTPAVAPEQQTPEDPVLAALTGIRQDIETLKAGQQTDPDLDLLTALTHEEPEEPVVQAPQQQPVEQQGAEGQRELEALLTLIDERADQRIQPLIQRDEQARAEKAASEMKAVQQRHPDIMEPQTLQTISDRIGALEARTGAEGLLADPEMVEQMYRLVKAESADAGAVAPAEVGGAVLETNAGQSQTGGSSFEDDYRSQVFGKQQRQPSYFG